MSLFLLVRLAFPCAGLLHGESVHVESNTQHVIMSLNGDNTISEYRIEYEGDTDDFGWVIPIFGNMVSIEEGDGSIFDLYEDITAPKIYENVAPESSCGPAAKGGDFSFEDERFVQGFTGTFEYVVVPATDVESFAAWGDVNGWNTASISTVLPQYSSEPNISLVLLRIRQDLFAGEVAFSPSIRLEFEGNEMRYPAMLGSISPENELHTVVYIQGEGNAEVGGWGQEDVGDISGTLDDDGTALYMQRLRDISETRASFGTVFAGDINGVWVTRLDSLVSPEQNTHEPFFQIGNEKSEIVAEVTLSENSSAWILGLGFLLGLFGLKRRR